jgi:FAD/FMN-containing dehydrogenase
VTIEPRVLRQFAETVGPSHVLTDADVVAGYAADFTGRFVGATPAVVRPADTEQVASVVAVCRSAGLPIVPQGGNTGLVGGGVPLAGEVLLSLRRIDEISDVDEVSGQLTAGAGASLATVQQRAAAAGWRYGVDMASRDSATIGGTVATNAGGLRVLRHGDTRAQVLGIEAVLGTGSTVSHLGGLIKDNTGYHLPSLLCGSEGTLGIVTAVRLRLVAPAVDPVVALVGLGSVAEAVTTAGHLRRQVHGCEAIELFVAEGLELVCRVAELPLPTARMHPAYLLVEVSGGEGASTALAAALDAAPGVGETAVATDAARAAQLWRYREAHTEAINSLGPPHKLDVTLPASALAEFMGVVGAAVHAVAPGSRTWLFGHAADGNVHVNVTGVPPDRDDVDDVVFELVSGYGGSISAEHGIGTAKRAWLHLNRSAAELDAFRGIKKALDPDAILNPNVLLSV